MATEMREPTFLVLASLAAGRKHGYAIISEADELSGGRVRLKVSTLYAALDRLAAEGLVERDGDEAVDGRLRRYFALTDAGAEALRVETDRLEHAARAARARLTQRAAAAASKPTAGSPAAGRPGRVAPGHALLGGFVRGIRDAVAPGRTSGEPGLGDAALGGAR